MITLFQTFFPPPNTPVVKPDGTMSTQGMAFWRALWGRTGQLTGIPNTVGLALTAAGTTQADALALINDWNQLTIVAALSGAILPGLTGGQSVLVANEGANALSVYPPVGSAIDALGANAAYSLASTKLQLFSFFSATVILSLKL